MNELVDDIAHMKEQDALNLAEKMLNEGENPIRILEMCREAVEYVGKQFEIGKYFLPELIMAGEMLKKISKMTEPFVKQDAGQNTERIGKVVIGSVKGDIHDIGKDIVIFMLDVNGFEVHCRGAQCSRTHGPVMAIHPLPRAGVLHRSLGPESPWSAKLRIHGGPPLTKRRVRVDCPGSCR